MSHAGEPNKTTKEDKSIRCEVCSALLLQATLSAQQLARAVLEWWGQQKNSFAGPSPHEDFPAQQDSSDTLLLWSGKSHSYMDAARWHLYLLKTLSFPSSTSQQLENALSLVQTTTTTCSELRLQPPGMSFLSADAEKLHKAQKSCSWKYNWTERAAWVSKLGSRWALPALPRPDSGDVQGNV